MKMFVIADNKDTLTGMHLAGIKGEIASDKQSFEEIFNRVLEDKTIGIVMIMESFSRKFPEIIGDLKTKIRIPLIVEIPDRHGTGRRPDFITSYINSAIGLKL